MIVLISSAAIIGFFHSLAPGHWLPVVLMAKARRWGIQGALLGAAVAALGHIIVSLALGGASIAIGSHFLPVGEEILEKYGSLVLVAFGFLFAGYSYFHHSSCHGHTHHGPDPEGKKAPLTFLFSLGLVPCVAVLPVFAAASVRGSGAILLAMVAFSVGVFSSLFSSTVLVSKGIAKLDHPILEHYGDVITGLGIVLMGVILFLVP